MVTHLLLRQYGIDSICSMAIPPPFANFMPVTSIVVYILYTPAHISLQSWNTLWRDFPNKNYTVLLYMYIAMNI